MTATAESRAGLLLTAFAVAASCLVLAAYAVRAAALIAYPWDWSPDEGLSLDYARRALQAPSTLYRPTAVPFPAVYGPLLPFLLAPVTRLGEPLFWARFLALTWTVLGCLASYLLVRKSAPPVLALACSALALAPFDLSFWHMIVRADGLMLSLWLLAAVPLLPRRLHRGADRLSWGRTLTGAALLLAAALAKASAVLHGAPLVLGWFLVDRRSAWRLCLVLGAAGLIALGLLEWATAGGFLWVNTLWRFHVGVPNLRRAILVFFLRRSWPLGVLCLLALASARARAGEAARDGALLLLLGCASIVPALSKFGAWWNYLLPGVPTLAILAGRWWGGLTSSDPVLRVPRPLLGAVLAAGLALGLAATREFPLPTAQDEITARAFFSFVKGQAARAGGPILVSRPDLAYFLVGQPVEVEGSSFPYLAAAGVPGVERVVARLARAEYTLVVETWPFPAHGGYVEAIRRSYADSGTCRLGYFLGVVTARIFTRGDVRAELLAPPGARCSGPAPGIAEPPGP